jgi:uncharacterized protein YaiE (UPF0345 family)
MQIPNVTAIAKANIYFDGRVISHSILHTDNSKQTLGVIFPGTYHFGTDAAEKMEITDGQCSVVLDGSSESKIYATDSCFEIPAKSGFTITVSEGLCQYVCSFLS